MVAMSGNDAASASTTSLYHASPDAIRGKIVEFLRNYNDTHTGSDDVRVLEGSTIIGYSPRQMARVASEALTLGDPLYYLRNENERVM